MSELFEPTRVVLIRHGESKVTVRRVVGGPRTCDGLSELGVRQAERLHDRLAESGEIEADHLYSSAYPRAIETAGLIAPALDLEVIVDERFGEHDPGPECDGVSFDDFVERYGMPDWETDPHAESFPGGETVAAFALRVGTAFSEVRRRHPGSTIVIVCHGGVIDGLLRSALRAPSTGVFEIHTVNTSLTEMVQVQPGKWRLLRYNDAAHLTGLPSATPRTSGG
jgi:probable phosphoglycerate mutase